MPESFSQREGKFEASGLDSAITCVICMNLVYYEVDTHGAPIRNTDAQASQQTQVSDDDENRGVRLLKNMFSRFKRPRQNINDEQVGEQEMTDVRDAKN